MSIVVQRRFALVQFRAWRAGRVGRPGSVRSMGDPWLCAWNQGGMAVPEESDQDHWVAYTEGRRRGAVLRYIALLFVALAAAFRGSNMGRTSAGAAFLIVGASSVLAVAVVVGFCVRPKPTSRGTSFFVLTPIGAVSGKTLAVADPNGTLPGRIVVASGGITWDSRRGGRLRWSRSEVADVAIRRVASFRPLGYLTINCIDGTSFTARIFQPREIATAFFACGFPRRSER